MEPLWRSAGMEPLWRSPGTWATLAAPGWSGGPPWVEARSGSLGVRGPGGIGVEGRSILPPPPSSLGIACGWLGVIVGDSARRCRIVRSSGSVAVACRVGLPGEDGGTSGEAGERAACALGGCGMDDGRGTACGTTGACGAVPPGGAGDGSLEGGAPAAGALEGGAGGAFVGPSFSKSSWYTPLIFKNTSSAKERSSEPLLPPWTSGWWILTFS
jgi:hypothetical protein